MDNETRVKVIYEPGYMLESKEYVAEFLEESLLKKVMAFFLHVLTLGLTLLMMKWRNSWKKALLFKNSNKDRAKYLFIKLEDLKDEIVEINETNILLDDENAIKKVIIFRFCKFFFDDVSKNFRMIQPHFSNKSYSNFYRTLQNGIVSEPFFNLASKTYGENILEIGEKSVFEILKNEILTPFNVFQIFSIIVWFLQNGEYIIFAYFLLIMTTISIIYSVWNLIQNNRRMKKMIYINVEVEVFRFGRFSKVLSKDLVPGDIIRIGDEQIIPADCLLIRGECWMNESMLSGESLPISKGAVSIEETETLDKINYKLSSTLFCGSVCLEAKEDKHNKEPLALVYKTGFTTYKGALALQIMFVTINQFSFLKDSIKFLIFFFILAVLGFSASIHRKIHFGFTTWDILITSLDLITISVPPLLPLTMQSGIEYSLKRLRNLKIRCIHPPKINLAGAVDILCLDKTGTLTEENLEVSGIISVSKSNFKAETIFSEFRQGIDQNISPYFLRILLSCHCLKVLKNDKVIGDPLDMKMLEYSEGKILSSEERKKRIIADDIETVIAAPQDKGKDEYFTDFKEIKVKKQFEFSAELQRLSVIVANSTGENDILLTKGSPEEIRNICLETQIPPDYNLVVNHYAKMGMRVIACAYKFLKEDETKKFKNSDPLHNMHLCGLLIFENKVKAETYPALKEIQGAEIKSVMITGDSAYTAMSVARKCGFFSEQGDIYLADVQTLKDSLSGVTNKKLLWKKIIYLPEKESDLENRNTDMDKSRQLENLHEDEHGLSIPDSTNGANQQYAITGNFIEYLREKDILFDSKQENVKTILQNTLVFARMKPYQKELIITYYKNQNLVVAMCGDASNDCLALKKADVSLSLSEEEASLAADFTSSNKNISAVVALLKQGRCAISTSLGSFKYMILFSIIQFTTVTLLYWFGTNLSSMQFLYSDLFLVLPLSITMNISNEGKCLSKERPATKLISYRILASVILIGIICAASQILVILNLFDQQFFVPFTTMYKEKLEENADQTFPCYESTILMVVGCYQYIFTAIAFYEGSPMRVPIYKNAWFLIILTLTFTLQIFSNFYGGRIYLDFININLEVNYSIGLLLISFSTGIIKILIDRVLLRKLFPTGR